MTERTPTIGWVKPGAVDLKIQHVFRMLPPGWNISILTTMWGLQMTSHENFDADAFAAQRGAILKAVSNLMEYSNLDVLAVTGDLLQAAMGVRWDREIRQAIAEASGLPTTTATTAVVDALTFLGARKVALGTPYSEKKTGYIRSYLEDAGFEVVAVVSHPTRSGKEIRSLPASAPYDTAKRLAAEAPNADALYLASPSWESTDYAERIEQEFGRPLVTMINSMLWRVETLLGCDTPVQGYGRLLASVNSTQAAVA